MSSEIEMVKKNNIAIIEAGQSDTSYAGLYWLRKLPPSRRQMYADYYNVSFDKNGCPLKLLENGWVFHPILAAYLIFDFVRAYENTRDVECLEIAEKIARCVLERAENVSGALVFYYREGDGLSSVPGKFYSALTQSWHVRAFCRLDRHRPIFGDAVRKLFASLQIPKAEGGVLMQKPFGWVVEEYPHEPPLYTLNGWLTVLRWIIECAGDLARHNIKVAEFLERNIDAAEALLPLFDAEFCLNSRYQLTGFSRIQVIVDREVEFDVRSISVEIPGEGDFPGSVEPGSSRWKNYLERSGGSLRQFNIVMSLVSSPSPNIFHLSFHCSAPCCLRIKLAKGKFRADCTGMPTEWWEDIARIEIETAGRHRIQCEIPFDETNVFAYPTNFKKYIRGEYYNGYHFIHIIDCAEIYRFCKRPVFRQYAAKFLKYHQRWEELQLPDDYALVPHIKYPGGFNEFILSMLK